MSADLLAKLIEAGTPANLVAEVAMAIARAEASGQDGPSKAALRQRRYEERKRQNASESVRSDDEMTKMTSSDDLLPLSPSPLSSPQTPKQTPHPLTPTRVSRAREDRFPAPDGVTAEQWAGFAKQRKKPLTDRAYSLLLGKLVDLANDGWPPGDMIDLATERGWETVFAPKDQRNGHQRDFNLGKPSGWTAGRARSGG
jgi:hypothetical protein